MFDLLKNIKNYKINDEYEKLKKEIFNDHITTKQFFISMASVGESFKDAYDMYIDLDEKYKEKLRENDKNYPTTSYEMSDSLRKKVIRFWDKDGLDKIENEYLLKIIPLPKENKKVIFLAPGFGFEEKGALSYDEKYTTRDLDAKYCYILAQELLQNKEYEIYLPFDLKYAGLELPNNDRLHVIFEGRPPIIGKSRKNKIVDASSSCMRATAEKILKNVRESDFVSLAIYFDQDDNEKTIGFKSYYQVDEKTSKKLQKNSKKFCDVLFEKCKDVFNVKEGNDAIEIKNHTIREDWLMANLGDFGEDDRYKDRNVALAVTFLGYVSNKKELEQIVSENKQKDMAIAIKNAFDEFFKKQFRA